MEDWDPAVVKLLSIFMPTTFERRLAIKGYSRFVHYTTAENLFHILDKEEVWFRNTRCMNDHRDIENGIMQLHQWSNIPESTASLVSALESCIPGVWQEGLKKYRQWLPNLRTQSYVLSVAEQDPDENETGRLSLWRAFEKGVVGVAVVVNVAPFMQMTDALMAYPSPVTYWTRQQFEDEFNVVTHRILANKDFLSQVNKFALTEMVFLMLLFAATCSKHPGLHHEREWRVLTNPLLWPSTRFIEHQAVIDSVPQTVYKLPLKNSPDDNLTGIELPELIDRVIIGPSIHAGPIRDAIVAKLAEKNVPDPGSKVVASGIPVRAKGMG
ncbi:hypothetical protein B5P45_20840 [Phyllobacterium zundukense]|uniref:DUF2971 domain-containing protein n=2 Tax=Phyllobacterium zundukense TaxID=1867719 RepID=A0A2N9VTS4_9HYPH|nr:hypothetical protein BLM14_17255 [Phyllobacterium zundukense]PIO42892.1 hypothetical protein B5P45_20840 [Phyllobacterium zundukense]